MGIKRRWNNMKTIAKNELAESEHVKERRTRMMEAPTRIVPQEFPKMLGILYLQSVRGVITAFDDGGNEYFPVKNQYNEEKCEARQHSRKDN